MLPRICTPDLQLEYKFSSPYKEGNFERMFYIYGMKRILLLLVLGVSLFSCKESEEKRNERIRTAILDSLNVDVVKLQSASISDLKLLKVEEIDAKHFAELKAKEVANEIQDWEQIKSNWAMEVENYDIALQLMSDTESVNQYSLQRDTAKENVAKADAYLKDFKKKYNALVEEQKKADKSKNGGYVVSTSFAFKYQGATDTMKMKYLVSDKMDVEVYPQDNGGTRGAGSYTPE